MLQTFVVMIILFSFSAFSKDLSRDFEKKYESQKRLSEDDLKKMRENEIILIPGILSEVLIESDRNARIDLSFLFNDYFGLQLKHLQNLNLPVKRLSTSSFSVEVTKQNIQREMDRLRLENKKAMFVTHSLGGLVLLDYILSSYPQSLDQILGIVFLQSPFYGAPVADVYLRNPYSFRDFATKIFPYINMSDQTVEYLSIKNRTVFMAQHMDLITKIMTEIPVITVSGIVNGYPSLFRPGAEVIHHGCIGFTERHCLTQQLYDGPYDLSDGMVTVNGSKLPQADFVQIHQVDHGEIVVSVPHSNHNRERMTEVFLKMMLEKVVQH